MTRRLPRDGRRREGSVVAPQGRGRLLHGRVLRWLLLVVVLLLAAGVLAMHGLGTGHGLTATGHTVQTATGHHHGAGAPSLDGTSDHTSAAAGDVGSGTSTWAGALHTTQRSGAPAEAPCQDDCGAHGAVAAMCLAVLAVALALLLAGGPAALRQPWVALPAPLLLGGRHPVLHRAPGLHQFCVSRT